MSDMGVVCHPAVAVLLLVGIPSLHTGKSEHGITHCKIKVDFYD